jgi:hypothetical protein
MATTSVHQLPKRIAVAILKGEKMNFKAGQYVRHSKYGNGTIVERTEDRTTVDFDTAGLKKFVTSLAAFEVAEGEAPKKRRGSAKRRTKIAEIAAKAVAV